MRVDPATTGLFLVPPPRRTRRSLRRVVEQVWVWAFGALSVVYLWVARMS